MSVEDIAAQLIHNDREKSLCEEILSRIRYFTERKMAEGPAYGIIDPDYARIFTVARLLAWQEGYALAMHGSFTRDLDLLAVPWTDKRLSPSTWFGASWRRAKTSASSTAIRELSRTDARSGHWSFRPSATRDLWTSQSCHARARERTP